MKLDCIVIQFAKYPRLGGVKTRLKPLLGDEGCYLLHQQLLKQVNANINDSGFFNVLALDQLGEHPVVNELAMKNCLILQEGNDLGERMKNAMHWGLKRAEKVIIVGSDCPMIKAQHLNLITEKLNSASHAFIPAEDGGYVLIACTQVLPEIFEGIAWGTEHVMQQTRDKLQQAKQSAFYAEPLWDVDRPEDYHRLKQNFVNWPNSQ